MAKPVNYDNQDGLRQRFGRRNTENNIPAVSGSQLGKKTIEFYIRGEDLTDVPAVADARGAHIPAGATILSARLIVQELFVGATATLDVGTQNASSGADVAVNGLIAAAAVASLTAGAVIVGAGTGVGAVTAVPTRLTASYNTAAFTAGSAKIIVEYVDPPVQLG
jgi:hypothetical protein